MQLGYGSISDHELATLFENISASGIIHSNHEKLTYKIS